MKAPLGSVIGCFTLRCTVTKFLSRTTSSQRCYQHLRASGGFRRATSRRKLSRRYISLNGSSRVLRPFDIGPRSCIGQTLTLNEIRIVLILAARSFTIEPAYDEWDRIQNQHVGAWSKVSRFIWGANLDTVDGEKAYQTEKAGTHPSDGYPCRVSLANA